MKDADTKKLEAENNRTVRIDDKCMGVVFQRKLQLGSDSRSKERSRLHKQEEFNGHGCQQGRKCFQMI